MTKINKQGLSLNTLIIAAAIGLIFYLSMRCEAGQGFPRQKIDTTCTVYWQDSIIDLNFIRYDTVFINVVGNEYDTYYDIYTVTKKAIDSTSYLRGEFKKESNNNWTYEIDSTKWVTFYSQFFISRYDTLYDSVFICPTINHDLGWKQTSSWTWELIVPDPYKDYIDCLFFEKDGVDYYTSICSVCKTVWLRRKLKILKRDINK